MNPTKESTANAGFSFTPFTVIAAQKRKKRSLPC